MSARLDIAAQAKAWNRKISATEKGYFIDRARRPRDGDGRARHNIEGLSRDAVKISELYPWPASEALRSAAEARIEKMQGGGDKKPKEYIRLTFDEGVLRLDAAGDLGESASEELDIEWSGTAALTCGFNWRYLDAVAALADSDEMRFWPDATGPGRVEPKHDDDRVYVVMPARV